MSTINKKEALKQLNELEAQAAKLREIIEAKDTRPITERVKTFEDALEIYKETKSIAPELETLLTCSGCNKNLLAAKAFAQMDIIREVLNEGWEPNWNDSNLKYWPWFRHSGSGLSSLGCGHGLSGSAVGSRLCYKSRELAEYAGKQFIEIYKAFHTL
jgi:hypothetical protein